MNKRVMEILIILILSALPLSGAQALTMNLYDLRQHRVLTGEEAVQALAPARIIIVGEHHDDPASHFAELTEIEVLEEAGRKPTIAMEMFRADSQPELNQWVAGKISEAKFKPIYLNNWNFPWSLYAPIFLYARANHIPMIGLNVPGGITTQVALEGFDSLSKKQRGDLQ
ncbi:MAG: ChaN family lipoprotein, partial [Desulfosarcinaceae bacterium]